MTLINVEIPKKVIVAAVLISLFAQLPNIYAALKTPQGYIFTGINSFLYNMDINTYFSAMRQGYEGSFLWTNLFTAGARGSFPLFPFYLILGHLAKFLRLSLPFVFNAASFVLAIPLLILVYVVIRFFLDDPKKAFLAFGVVSFGGGLGFLHPWVFPDTVYGEATVFLSLTNPHWVLDALLFLTTLLFGFRALTSKSWHFSWGSSLTGLLLATIHPYMLFVADVILGGYFCLSLYRRRQRFGRFIYLLPLMVVSVASGVFYYKLLFGDPFLRAWMSQNIVKSPPLLLLITSFGLIFPLAVFGLLKLWQNNNPRSDFLISWFFLQLFLIYLPVGFQLQMLKNYFVVLGIVAVVGLILFRLPSKFYALVLVTFFLAQPTVLAWRFFVAHGDYQFVYLPLSRKESFDWLQENTGHADTVLASLTTGNFIPAYSGRRVVSGYAHWTPDYATVTARINRFYRGDMPELEAYHFLRTYRVDYIYYGGNEKEFGAPDFGSYGFLSEVYNHDDVQIYKVSKN